MRFNLDTLTEDQEWKLFQLKRSDQMRFSLDYIPEKSNGWNHSILESNDFDEIFERLKTHYQSLLKADKSFITDFDTKAKYEIYDFSENADASSDVKCLAINIGDLNRLSFMLYVCGANEDSNSKP